MLTEGLTVDRAEMVSEMLAETMESAEIVAAHAESMSPDDLDSVLASVAIGESVSRLDLIALFLSTGEIAIVEAK